MLELFIYNIILDCLQKINGERTIYSIYHLLNGKKSSQTIQDAHLFQISHYFGTYDCMTKQQFQEWINTLNHNEFIARIEKERFIVTEKGFHTLQQCKEKHQFLNELDGWKYQNAIVFWERLSLFTQVISHLMNDATQYIPVQRNPVTKRWLKRHLQNNQFERNTIGDKLMQELVSSLEYAEGMNPSLFVIRLTGYNRIGLTEIQAAITLGIEQTYYHYQFLSWLHYLMRIVHHNSKYPILNGIAADLDDRIPLTASTKKTFEYLQLGYSMEEISGIRNLKLNTIEDHVVELAQQIDSFDISAFVTEERIEVLRKALQKTETKRLKVIKEMVPEANYFEIRLILNKFGDET